MSPDVEERVATVRQYLAFGKQAGYDVTPGYSAFEFLVRHIAAQDSLLEQALKPKLPDPGKKDIGQFVKDSPHTSRDAAVNLYPLSGRMRLKVFRVVDDHGGLCDEQGEDVTGMSHQSWSARRYELVKGGWLEDSGRTHRNRSGQDAVIWIVTEKARLEEAS